MSSSLPFFGLPTPLLDLIYEFSGNQKQLKCIQNASKWEDGAKKFGIVITESAFAIKK